MSRTKGRTCALAIVTTCVAVAISSTSQADVPNTIPFDDSFESFTEGQHIVDGATGWLGATSALMYATAQDYSTVSYPLATNHSLVARLDAGNESVSNTFAQLTRTNIWIDMNMQMVRWDEDTPPGNMTNDNMIQTAVYLASNGQLVVFHSDPLIGDTSNRWTMLDHETIETQSWHRLTVKMDYLSALYGPEGVGLKFFQVHLDGSVISNEHAHVDPSLNSYATNGSWFICANGIDPNPYLQATIFKGSGYLDDFVVTDQEPSFPTNQIKIAASVKPADKGSVAPSGDVFLTQGDDQAFQFATIPYYEIADIYTNGTSIANLTTDYVGATNYTFNWSNITETGTIMATVIVSRASNGVPHWWLALYDLTDWEADAAGNEDNDPSTTKEEWLCSTDPTDSNSFCRIQSIDVMMSSSNGWLTWMATNVDDTLPPFTIQRVTDLVDGTWTNAGTKAREDGTNVWSEDIGEMIRAFYRLFIDYEP